MPRGGFRSGAGRKPKVPVNIPAPVAAAARVLAPSDSGIKTVADLRNAIASSAEEFQRIIIDNQPRLVQAMVDIATGIKQVRVTADGEEQVYSSPPDRQAIEYLLSMLHGKPTTRTEQKVDTTITVITSIPRPSFGALPDGVTIDVEATEDD